MWSPWCPETVTAVMVEVCGGGEECEVGQLSWWTLESVRVVTGEVCGQGEEVRLWTPCCLESVTAAMVEVCGQCVRCKEGHWRNTGGRDWLAQFSSWKLLHEGLSIQNKRSQSVLSSGQISAPTQVSPSLYHCMINSGTYVHNMYLRIS